jgi:homoserine dehydrogenase
VGAGLPILGSLRVDLVQTGDEVKKIEGIFSGTLSYLFNTFKPGMKFSDVINDAKEKVYIIITTTQKTRASRQSLIPHLSAGFH